MPKFIKVTGNINWEKRAAPGAKLHAFFETILPLNSCYSNWANQLALAQNKIYYLSENVQGTQQYFKLVKLFRLK